MNELFEFEKICDERKMTEDFIRAAQKYEETEASKALIQKSRDESSRIYKYQREALKGENE